MSRKAWLGNLLGAFADGAILFPLLAALSLMGGFSGPVLLASTGLAYWASGLFFRVPISVQPLKSIAIAAVATGATSLEVRWSGFALAIFCLVISVFNVNAIARRIPSALIQGVQAGLGVILVLQGVKAALGTNFDWRVGIEAAGLCVAMLALPSFSGVTALGLLAAAGMAWAVVSGWNTPVHATSVALPPVEGLRAGMIFSLVLPQMALTLANSVVGTQDVCSRYFGEKAKRVTVRNLLRSIGLGNVLAALVGGLPYCHGAGGVTAHFRAGTRHWAADGVIGSVLLVLALVQFLNGHIAIQYPPVLMASLLAATGFFHLKLAAPTWAKNDGRLKLLLMMGVAILGQNILWVLLAGIFAELFAIFVGKTEVVRDPV